MIPLWHCVAVKRREYVGPALLLQRAEFVIGLLLSILRPCAPVIASLLTHASVYLRGDLLNPVSHPMRWARALLTEHPVRPKIAGLDVLLSRARAPIDGSRSHSPGLATCWFSLRVAGSTSRSAPTFTLSCNCLTSTRLSNCRNPSSTQKFIGL